MPYWHLTDSKPYHHFFFENILLHILTVTISGVRKNSSQSIEKAMGIDLGKNKQDF